MPDYSIHGTRVPVLDAGWVELVDSMGSDRRMVERARLSYLAEWRGWDKELPLLNFLMRHQHKSPFQAGRMVLRAQLPIETIREIDRHRTLDLHGDTALVGVDGSPVEYTTVDPRRKFLNKNEASGRYIDMTLLPVRKVPAERIRGKGVVNKQSSEGQISDESKQWFMERESQIKDSARRFLREATEKHGIAYEIARGVLPVDQYTVIELDADCLWWIDFLRLRLAPGAKEEVRLFAGVVCQFFTALFPHTFALAEEHVFKAVHLSGTELDAIRKAFNDLYEDSPACNTGMATKEELLMTAAKEAGLSGGIIREFVQKFS